MIMTPNSARAGEFRLRRGTKSSAVKTCTAETLPALSAIDGPFQLAEFLALKVRADPHDVAGLVEVPAEGRSTDRDVWIYEHLRRLPIDLTPLVSQLLSHCSKESCPEMKADQWQYLCVAHGSGVSEECCAIDYILHTLDSATTILNSTKNFPSRMSIPPGSLSHFPSLSRRLSRIFSHAYFHHREQFLLSESETSLYARFVALCETYGLVGNDLLIIPHATKAVHSAEDDENDEEDDGGDGDDDEDGQEADRNREKEKGGGKRTLSLDRQSGVGFKMLSREKGKGRVTEDEADAESAIKSPSKKEKESIPEETKEASPPPAATPTSLLPKKQADDKSDSEPPTSTAKNVGTMGRGTKGRGKQSRGTVLWSSDSADAPAVPDLPTLLGGQPLERSESRESAIFIGGDEVEGEEPSPESFANLRTEVRDEAEHPVPKDEIELLEEAGKLDIEPTVSPLPPAPAMVPDTPHLTSSVRVSEDAVAEETLSSSDESTEPAKTVSFAETPETIPPSTSPKASTVPIFPPTAATSPLNPPRSLSRSPEARYKALSGAGAGRPKSKGADVLETPASLSGLPKIDVKKGDGDELDAEGSKAIITDGPDQETSSSVEDKGEDKESTA